MSDVQSLDEVGSNMNPPFLPGVALIRPSSRQPLQRAQEPGNVDAHPRELILPAVYHDKFGKLQKINPEDKESLVKYLQQELDLSRLDDLHHHLWLVGRSSVAARALQRQLMIGREIILTEQADLHLVWQDSRIYLKPMPEFLLNHNFWTEYLCEDEALWESARGFLLSYLWLVSSKIDLQIAHDKGLLPLEIQWDRWVLFSKSLLHDINIKTIEQVNRRFLYGELRLNRLNLIYRIVSLPHDPKNFVLGYKSGFNRYSLFVARSFAWTIGGAFVYITIVLTAMQVGLATDRLRNDDRFQNASYGFTVFAILAPIAAVGIVAILLSVILSFHLLEALKQKKTKPNRTPTYNGNFPGTTTV